MIASKQLPHQVRTHINYHKVTGKPLVPMVIGNPAYPPIPQPKILSPVTITDVTSNEENYRLDNQGFQYVKHESQLSDWDDDDTIKRIHYVEMEDLVRKVLTDTKSLVHILTHIIRRGPKDGGEVLPGAGPLKGVHVDQSFAAAKGVAERFLGESAASLLIKPRYQIVNTWRPLAVVTRDPLAVSDANSIPDSDLITVPIIFPTHHTEAIEVRPAPDETKPHKWYYKQNQRPDDVLFFMQVDSYDRKGVPRRVPHCAFNDPDLPDGYGYPRASIEIRALVFYDEIVPSR